MPLLWEARKGTSEDVTVKLRSEDRVNSEKSWHSNQKKECSRQQDRRGSGVRAEEYGLKIRN